MTPGAERRRAAKHENVPKIQAQLASRTRLGHMSTQGALKAYAKKRFDYTWKMQRNNVHKGARFGMFWWEANALNTEGAE